MNRHEQDIQRLFKDHRHKQEWVRVRDLKIDRSYQRPVKPALVRTIAADFNADAFHSLFVARRGGENFVVDGQQRLMALLKMGWENQRVPCEVIEDTTQAIEAAIFRTVNEERRSVLPLESFRAALVEGSQPHIRLKRVIEECGFSLPLDGASRKGKAGSIGCVGRLLTIWRDGQGKQALVDVLGVIKACWPEDEQGTSPDMIGGLYIFLMRYDHLVIVDRLKVNLRFLPPGVILAEGAARGELMRASRQSGVASRLREAYNLGSRSGVLPEWEFGVKAGAETHKAVLRTSETKPPLALVAQVFVGRQAPNEPFTTTELRQWVMKNYDGYKKGCSTNALTRVLAVLRRRGLVKGGRVTGKGTGNTANYWRLDGPVNGSATVAQ